MKVTGTMPCSLQERNEGNRNDASVAHRNAIKVTEELGAHR